MTDRPRGDGDPEDGSPDFHWLYGGGDGAGNQPDPRPDETRVMPVQPRPSGQSGQPVPPPQQPVRPPTQPPYQPPPPQQPGSGAKPARRRWRPRRVVAIVLLLLLAWLV